MPKPQKLHRERKRISHNKHKPPTRAGVVNMRAARAALLDREADVELQRGYIDAAERLSHRADVLRGSDP